YLGRPPKLVRRTDSVVFAGTFELAQAGGRYELIAVTTPTSPTAVSASVPAVARSFDGVHLQDVASQVGLDFRQDDFRFGVSPDVHSMMGGGLCWIDYNHDGWLDLFVVNSYSDGDITAWNARGGPPRSVLYENVHG